METQEEEDQNTTLLLSLYRIFTEPKYSACIPHVLQQLSPDQAIELMQSCPTMATRIRRGFDWRRLFSCNTNNNHDIALFPGLLGSRPVTERFHRIDLKWLAEEPPEATDFLRLFVSLQNVNKVYLSAGAVIFKGSDRCFTQVAHPTQLILKYLEHSIEEEEEEGEEGEVAGGASVVSYSQAALPAAIRTVLSSVSIALKAKNLEKLVEIVKRYKLDTPITDIQEAVLKIQDALQRGQASAFCSLQ